MYIFKNAIKSITRSKGRNILIGIILTVIAISSCVALSIKNSATEVVNSYKDSYDITATLSLNRQSLQSQFKNGGASLNSAKEFMDSVPAIDAEMIKKYGDSEYVKSYYYTSQLGVDSSTIQKVTSTEAPQDNKRGQFVTIAGGNGSSGDFRLIGYSSLDAMTQFISGTYKITEGTMFDINGTDNPCVITNELAEANSLTVGSTITITNPNKTDETYTFKVVGIYTDTSSNDSEFSMFSQAANQILTNYITVDNMVTNSEKNADTKFKEQVNSTFKLTGTDVIDSFSSELTSKGLSSYYTVNTNLESFNESVKPLENLSSFATVFLILVLVIGGIILAILNMINIRERKYEIGVLRAIGMKKHKVLGQFLTELLVVTMISILIGTIIGSIVSVPTANYMLKNEISSQQSSQDQINQNFGRGVRLGGDGAVTTGNGKLISMFGGNSNVNYVDQINAVIDAKTILELALIGIVLTVISGSISMIFISRYTPLKILSSRT